MSDSDFEGDLALPFRAISVRVLRPGDRPGDLVVPRTLCGPLEGVRPGDWLLEVEERLRDGIPDKFFWVDFGEDLGEESLQEEERLVGVLPPPPEVLLGDPVPVAPSFLFG